MQRNNTVHHSRLGRTAVLHFVVPEYLEVRGNCWMEACENGVAGGTVRTVLVCAEICRGIFTRRTIGTSTSL